MLLFLISARNNGKGGAERLQDSKRNLFSSSRLPKILCEELTILTSFRSFFVDESGDLSFGNNPFFCFLLLLMGEV